MCFILQEGVEKFRHRIHAFCFMKNHIHLLIQIGTEPLSIIMHNLASRFSNKINRRYGKIGHLFQGRYKAILVQDELYFKQLLRYIHRNPVRAGIATSSEDYLWSSHDAYVGRNRINWLTKDFGLSKFGYQANDAIIQYVQFTSMMETDDELEELRSNFKDGHVLGNDDFLNFVRNQRLNQERKPLAFEAIMKEICDEFKFEKELIFSKDKSRKISYARGLICVLGIEEGDLSLTALGRLLNRDQSTISRLIKTFKKDQKSHLAYNEKINILRNQLHNS